jgi:hypothetical protein
MRTKFAVIMITLLFILTGCSNSDQNPMNSVELKVTDGVEEVFYSVTDLEGFAKAEAAFQGETYQGVPLATLLSEAGFNPSTILEVEAIAQDGFSATYTSDLFQMADTLVAYATKDGPMVGDDGVFRMVLPDQPGKLNVRQLIEIHVKP